MSTNISVDKFYSKPFQHDLNVRKFNELARIEASEEEKQYKVKCSVLSHFELDDVR